MVRGLTIFLETKILKGTIIILTRMTKTKKINKKVNTKTMSADIFEKKYQKEIEIMTEQIIDKHPKIVSMKIDEDLSEDEYDGIYDDAFEEAVYVLASEKGIELE
jgi:hypothetical protein